MSTSLPASSLALALGGFSLDAESEFSALEAPAPLGAAGAAGAAAANPRAAVGADALVGHARAAVGRALACWSEPSCNLQQEADNLASLCFALRSAVGCTGRLSDDDEAALFDLAAGLWVSDRVGWQLVSIGLWALSLLWWLIH